MKSPWYNSGVIFQQIPYPCLPWSMVFRLFHFKPLYPVCGRLFNFKPSYQSMVVIHFTWLRQNRKHARKGRNKTLETRVAQAVSAWCLTLKPNLHVSSFPAVDLSCVLRVFPRVLRLSSLIKIDISRQYGPTVIGTCYCGDPAHVAKPNKIHKPETWNA